MQRKLVCHRCNCFIENVECKKIQFIDIPKKSIRLCVVCREVSKGIHIEKNKSDKMRAINRDRMLERNPMLNIDTVKKVSETLKLRYSLGEITSVFSCPEKLKEIKSKGKITDDGRKRLSEKMKRFNPMFNPTVCERVHTTLKRKIENKEYCPKKGSSHHLWKGNRKFSEICRVRLYGIWVNPILERDNYQCQYCGTNKKLQVHHIKPLREFISEIKKRYNISSLEKLNDVDKDKYVDIVVNEHKLEDGITVCSSCHKNIDKFYKYENSKNSKRTI